MKLIEDDECTSNRRSVDIVEAIRKSVRAVEQPAQHLVVRCYDNSPSIKELVVGLFTSLHGDERRNTLSPPLVELRVGRQT
ncbi:MAG TPA: hypothetical protein V6D08_06245 [Candidatus Obscuribacterales bacterium]